MLAIEFEADVHNGVIEISEEYKDKLPKHIKVIALMDEQPEQEVEAQYSDEYIEKNWRKFMVTSNMGGNFENSELFQDQRASFLMDKYH